MNVKKKEHIFAKMWLIQAKADFLVEFLLILLYSITREEDIEEGAEDLHEEGGDDDGRHEMWHVHPPHDVIIGQIRQDGYDVRHHTLLTVVKVEWRPSVVFAVGVDEHTGQQDGEGIRQRHYHQLV